jgi:hypothetical protein
MKAVSTSETSVSFCKITLRNLPEDKSSSFERIVTTTLNEIDDFRDIFEFVVLFVTLLTLWP